VLWSRPLDGWLRLCLLSVSRVSSGRLLASCTGCRGWLMAGWCILENKNFKLIKGKVLTSFEPWLSCTVRCRGSTFEKEPSWNSAFAMMRILTG